MKRRVTILFCCFAACLVLLSGCISVIDAAPHSSGKQSKADNVNLLFKIDVEKNGVLLDSISSIASKDSITISDSCQEKQNNSHNIILTFTGRNIKNVSEDSYSMVYGIGLQVPSITCDMVNNGPSGSNSSTRASVQYVTLNSNSSINVKSGQPVCIYENNVYKVKLTITIQK